MTNDWALDPLPILRNARNQLVDLRRMSAAGAEGAPEAALTTDVGPDAFAAAMSDGLSDLVRQYQEAHDGATLEFLRYVRTADAEVELVLDAGSTVSDESKLVHLTLAATAADVDGLHVVAEILIAHRGDG